MKEEETAAW